MAAVDPKETSGPSAFDVGFHCKKRTFGHGRLRERILPEPTGALMGWIFGEKPKPNVTDLSSFGLTVLSQTTFSRRSPAGNVCNTQNIQLRLSREGGSLYARPGDNRRPTRDMRRSPMVKRIG